MLMKDFRRVIAANACIELKSYHTDELIKECKAVDLTENDLNLRIDSIFSCGYFNARENVHSGKFIILVDEDE